MTTQNSLFDTSQAPQGSVERYQVEERARSGARWFYWIAALSFITSIISLTGSNWGFVVSLGVTQIIDAVAKAAAPQLGEGVKVVALVFDAVAAGLFALIGYFAAKRFAWLFVVGMVVYLLDGLIFLLARDFLAIAFHAFVLYSIYGGYKAAARLAELDREAAAAANQPPPPPAPAAQTAG